MKKYAMIPINRKYDEDNTLHIRRVLISYEKKKKKSLHGMPISYFEGTKLIEVDDYFKENHSHTYKFTDTTYTLVDCDAESKKLYGDMLSEPRKYHAFEGSTIYGAILFKASSDQEAIKKFKERGDI